jgi:hypothetical protein
MAQEPEVRAYWDEKRGGHTYRVCIPGTSKFLLFDDHTVLTLVQRVEQARKGTMNERSA